MKTTIVKLTAILLLLAGIGYAAPKPVNFEFVDFSESVNVTGINNAGDIVGSYWEQSTPSISHGFIRKASGELITLGVNEQLTGIDNEGRVVGIRPPNECFLYQNGEYTTIAFPGAIQAFVYGINAGRIVGHAQTGSNSGVGFIWENGSFTTLEYPGANATVAMAINGDKVVGFYWDEHNHEHGFVYEAGQYRTLDFDQAFSTHLTGINSKGVTIGWVQKDYCTIDSFAVVKGKTLLIDLPVKVAGINDNDLIVGSLITKGFIARLSHFLLKH